MSLRKHSFFYFRIIVALSFTTLSCAGKQVYRSHPELMTLKKDIKTIGIVPFDVKVYKSSPSLKLRDDWSNQARENIMKALVDVLKGKSVEIKTLTLDKEDMQEKIDNLYRAVDQNLVWWDTYGAHPLPEIENILNAYGVNACGVDALVFVYGRKTYVSAGIRALGIVGLLIVLPFFVIDFGPLMNIGKGFPVHQSIAPKNELDIITITLVNRSGAILWYKL